MNWLLQKISNLHNTSLAFAFILLATFSSKSQSITSISPTSGGIGTAITITGTGFNASAPNDVFFGPVKVTVSANAAGTSIVVNVPAGASSYTTLIVRNNATGLQASSLSSNTPYFTITHSPALSITPASYNISADLPGSSSQAIASGDFDNDGYADIVTGSGIVGSFATMLVFKNNGLGDFPTSFPRFNMSGTSSADFLKTSDLDGDGNLDIVAAKSVGGNLDIFKGNGDGTFLPVETLPGTGAGAGLALEDINNDGIIDIITAGAGILNIFIGDGFGNFAHAPSSPKSILGNTRNVSLADLNKNGFLDIIIAGFFGTNSVMVFFNNQDETFADALLFPTGNNPFHAISGDYDGDGNMDIAALSLASDNITILQGNGLGGFVAFPSSPIAIPIGDSYGLEQGDFDGDGNIDFVVSGNSNKEIPLLKGDGTGGFVSFPSFPFSVGATDNPFHIISGDFNNDGVADIPFANWGSKKFRILLSPQSFRTTWVTNDTQITIPTTGGGYNYDIVWTNLTNTGVGNGAITGINGNYTITGLTNGDTYQVLIRGDFPRIYFNNGSEKDKIMTVEEWGNIAWGSMETAFYGCTNLTIPATDAPDLSNSLSLNQTFRGATSFNQSINHWDVSNIILFYGTFWDATSYNQPLNSWVLTNATSISTMFQGATNFNQSLSNWAPANITDIKVMFKNATSFNQPVNHFDVNQVVDFAGTFEGATSFDQPLNNWDMSSATNTALMFWNNSAFNQPLGTWDVSNVTNMSYMFGNATSFDQDLGAWDISSATNMADMLWLSDLSIVNYDNTLIGWATLTGAETQIPTGILIFRANGLSYCNSELKRQSLIDTYSWVITLDTQSGLCEPNLQASNLIVSNISSSQIDLSWTNGNGSNRIVVMREGSAVTTDPSNFVTYVANSIFGSGTQIGVGNYVTYNGTGSSLTITGLTPGNTYHVRLYEYNGTLGIENYLTTTAVANPFNFTTYSPEINLFNGSTNASPALVDAQVTAVNFGSAVQTNNITQTFAIENTGTSDLVISSITTSGTDYSVSSAIATIGMGVTETFTVTLSGANTGTFNAVITIASDDTDENPFTFPITGAIVLPFNLASTAPFSNAANVLTNSNISLDFDSDVDLSSVHNGTTASNAVYDDNITITGNLSGQIEGTYSIGADNSIIIFDPSTDFKAGEKITVVVNNNVMGTGGEIALPTSFSFVSATGPFEGVFIEKPSGILGMADGNFDWGDYDNDGDLDVIVTGFDPSFNNQATIYNNSGGTFTDIGAGLIGVFFSSSDWGDYDNDGDLDLVVAGMDPSYTNRITTIYRNDAGVFTDIGAGLQGVDYASVDWGDYDNDGDLDLIVAGSYSSGPDLASSTIYQNNGGVFTDIGAGLQALNNGSADWGDYDADGDLDLLLTGFNSDWTARITVLYDNTNGVFTDHLATLPNVAWGDADWADYDNDGDLDLLLSGDGPVLTYTSIFNNAGGVFTDIGAGFPTTSEGSVRWGDYDGDGELDVVLTGQDYSTGTNITNIYKNQSGGVFTDINAGLHKVYFTGLAEWGDFDGDGDLDILVAGEANTPSSTSAVLYENTVPPFITTWVTTDGEITIPTSGAGYNYNIVWTNLTNTGVGDGAIGGVSGDYTVTSLTNGDTYQIKIWGSFPHIYFNNTFGNKTKIKTIEQWGGNPWQDFTNAFMGCNQLEIKASDAPNLAGVTSLSHMFGAANNVNAFTNADFSGWNTSNITDMSFLFDNAYTFNLNINTWDVSNVTNMDNLFNGTTAFNQPLNNWDVSSATNMESMFYESDFNQPIDNWDVSSVNSMFLMFGSNIVFNQPLNSWDVSSVANLSYMFNYADAFNQPLNTWNVSNVTDMSVMFEGAASFNQSLGDWNIASVTDMSFMLDDAGLSTANYDATLIGWADDNSGTETIPSNITLDAYLLTYCVGASAHATLLAGPYNWTITDAGVSCPEIKVFAGNDNTGTSILDAQLTAIDFGFAVQFNNITQSFAIENTGSNTLNISSITASGTDYSVSNAITAVAIGATETFTVTLSGASTGPFNTIITIANDDTDENPFTFPITGEITVPEINIFTGNDNTGTPLVDAQVAAVDFGSAVQTNNITQTFAVENTGTSDLAISSITASGTDYSVSSAIAIVVAGATQTFTITLSGASTGTFNSTITIASDDADENPFTFPITGEITVPEINLYIGNDNTGAPLVDAQVAAVDFGSAVQTNNITQTFAVENTGTSDLAISSITVSGTDYSVSSTIATIGVGATETFTVTLSGASTGTFNSTITIASDDTDENPFTFPITGEITVPEINLYIGNDNTGAPLVDAQVAAVDFGSAVQTNNITQTFAVENTGTSDLAISSITASGTDYAVSSAITTIGVGATETFTVTLSGTSTGTFNSTITITNDDADENPFTLPITGIITAPEINVFTGTDNTGTTITDAQATAIDYGNATVGTDIAQTFAIENTGTSDLTISSITASGTDYSVSSAIATIGVGATETFTVTLSGASTGPFNTIITITNDDTDENPFTFPITGEITAPEINVFTGTDNTGTTITDAQITAIDYGNATIGTDIAQTFAVENTGTSDLNISSITTSGTDYSVSSAIATIGVGATETFTVTLSGASTGTFNTTITIASDDADEDPFTFDITGIIDIALAPEINVFTGTDNTGTTITDAQATVIDYGNATIGTDIAQTFAVENTGTSDLTISSITASGTDYSVSSTIATIGVGATETFTVTLSGTSTGTFNTTITIASDDADEDPFTFDITGIIDIALAPEINVFTGIDNTGTTITDEQITAIDYGNAVMGTDITQTFAIENIGSADLIVSSITATGTDYSVASAFASVAVGSTETFTVTLSGANIGTFETEINILSNDADESSFIFQLRGSIEGTTVIDGTDTDGTVIISNQEVNIGTTVVNTDIDKVFVIENLSATNDLIINSIISDNPIFEVIDPPNTISPSEFKPFTVRLLANEVGTYQGTLSVSTNLNDFTFIVAGEVLEGDLSTITVYNAITPNGDGVHDYLKINNLENFAGNSVRIYNRWGDTIYEVKGYNNLDIRFEGVGNMGRSKDLDTGNYYYIINKGNGEEELTGFIFLKR